MFAKVTSRIMDMYRNGEIDSSLAMQLLGGALATSEDGNSRKRSLDDASGPDEVKAAKIGEADPDAPSVEELLDQAKKVKNDTRLNYIISIIFFLGKYIIITFGLTYILDGPTLHLKKYS